MGLGGSEEKEKRRRKRTLLRRNTGAVETRKVFSSDFFLVNFMETFSPRVLLFETRGILSERQSVRTSLPYGTMAHLWLSCLTTAKAPGRVWGL